MNPTAKLVWDQDSFHISEEVGEPREDQMCGMIAEKLCEMAGRICYDSLGKGRSSIDYHKHILQVKHYSIYEHFNVTIEVEDSRENVEIFANRPGVWMIPGEDCYRVSLNLRSVLDWDNFNHLGNNPLMQGKVQNTLHYFAPNVISQPNVISKDGWSTPFTVVKPVHDEEKWVSLYLSCSRGVSHEQVRHKYRTAVSQRSTRYVDESTSGYVIHPLIQNASQKMTPSNGISLLVQDAAVQMGSVYQNVCEALQAHLTGEGVSPGSARKQARGAARGVLGNALRTEMIFSASVAQWRRMIEMRLTDAADAEIRMMYEKVLGELRASQYGDRFADYELAPASDGIGNSLR